MLEREEAPLPMDPPVPRSAGVENEGQQKCLQPITIRLRLTVKFDAHAILIAHLSSEHY